MNKKRRRLHFENIRALSLRDILEQWQKEADFPAGAMERELKRAVLNLAGNWRDGDLIDPLFPDDELPGMDTLVDKDWLTDFCGKGDWPFPKFWFPRGMEEIERPGRPSIKSAIVQEFRNRLERGETCPTISEEARAIHPRMIELGYERVPEAKTIQGHIREEYNARKRRHNL